MNLIRTTKNDFRLSCTRSKCSSKQKQTCSQSLAQPASSRHSTGQSSRASTPATKFKRNKRVRAQPTSFGAVRTGALCSRPAGHCSWQQSSVVVSCHSFASVSRVGGAWSRPPTPPAAARRGGLSAPKLVP